MTNVAFRKIQTVAILAGLVNFAPAVLAQVEISPSAMFPAGAEIDETSLSESKNSPGNATVGDATVSDSAATTDINSSVEPAAETTESETEQTPSAPVTLETIQQQLAELEADKETPDATRTNLKQLLQRTADSIKGASEASGLMAKYRTEIEEAPARLDSLKKKLSTPLPSVPAFAPDTPIDDLVRVLQDLRQQLENAKRSRDTHAEQWKSEAERQVEWNRKIEETTKKLEDANGEPPVESDDARIQQAHRAERTTRIQLLEKQLELFKLEQRRSDALSSLRPVQQDLDQVTVKQLEEQTQALGKEVGRRRQLETQRQAEEARRQAREADPALQELANGNTELAEARAKYSSRLTQLYSELNLLNEKMATEDQAFSEIKNQADTVGMSETIGVLLRSLRDSLLDTTSLKERRKSIAKEMPAIQLQISQFKDERMTMSSLNELTEEQLSKVGASLLERYKPTEAKRLIVDLLEARKTYLDETIHDLTKYAQKLSELDNKAKSCITATSEHAKYIDEHVLWIRSTEPIQLEDLVAARSGLEQIVTGSRWAEVVRNIGNAIRQNLWQSFGVLLLIALGLGFRDRLLDRIQTISQSKTVTFSYSFLPTVKCLILTAIAASFWPSVVFLVGWRLRHGQPASELTLSVGDGLKWFAICWWPLYLLHIIVRPNGLGEKHFGWHPGNLRVLRSNISWLVVFALPMVFFVVGIQAFEGGAWSNSLGRLSFIVGMTLLGVFMHFLLGPYSKSNGIWAKQQVWTYKLRFLLHAIGVALPISLSVLAAVGYLYSAHQLAYRGFLTLWLIVSVVLSHAILSRYLLIRRRHVAVKHMRQRKADEAEKQADGQEIDIPEEKLDFAAIGTQLQRLLRGAAMVGLLVGSSLIWADMVPALMIFDRIELWQIEGPDNSLVWITLADVILCIGTFVATLVAARNLPGLFNITIFERLPIDFGTRYAFTLVTRYLIFVSGFAFGFRFIGITWNSVQWLVAAMTVGLGFGLQEIFANFVSGLIILTERPVRVGDMVTVGGVTGKVTRMQMRATTITDFDRRELVVPNKKFITEDVINWTLSDPITRVVLPVGISYGCDPEIARMKLLEVAHQNALILDEPQPEAIFVGFGDNTLNLELRVFMIGRDNKARLQDEVNRAINRVFREAKLEIAFPQRDLHIRSIDPAVASAFLELPEKKAKGKAA